MARYTFAQLAQLWTRAGGPRDVAPVMAAIALAESRGDPGARNPSGASGLWQILGLPFPGDPFNPEVNARMAVAKYHTQGLKAWETYTNGAYREFLPTGAHGQPAPAPGGAGGGLFGWPGEIVGVFSGAGAAVDWLIQPSHWIRIFAFIAGVTLTGAGVFLMSHAGGQV